MKASKLALILSLQLFLTSSVFAQKIDNALSAKDVINRAINAMGGKDVLLPIKTLYTDISTEMEGRQVHWITKEMLPNKGAFQVVYNDRIVFQNWFDGKTGYEISSGKKAKADPSEFKDKQFKKNIFNELDYLDSTLYRLELVREEKVSNEDCYKIKATLINGLVKLIYISKATFYTLREDKVSNKEKDSFSTTLFSDYKKFGNLTYYTVMKFGEADNYQTGKIITLLVNEKISEEDFK